MPKQSGSNPNRFRLSDEQRLSWLRLIRSDNVGPATFRDLINHFGSALDAIDALPELAKRGGAASRIRICSIARAEKELLAAQRLGARFIGMGEPDYPAALRALDSCPPLLCVRGDGETLKRVSVGIVGARNASITGCKLAQRFSQAAGQAGYTVVSGLARGIDTQAHQAALETGTVAAFAGGVDHVFPEENQDLAAQILAKSGAIVSEMPIGWRPRANDFPRRNRIIVGLSLGVVVVEAARRSGSLISARLANEAGRLVFAVPGSPLDPRSEGTNYLIKQGATLITKAEDLLDGLEPMDSDPSRLPFEEVGNDLLLGPDPMEGTVMVEINESLRAKIIAALGPSPVEIDDILRYCEASHGEVQLVLVELDLAGRLERHSGNRVSLIG